MALFSFSSSCELENVNFMTAEKCKQYNLFKIVGRYGIKLHVIKLKATTDMNEIHFVFFSQSCFDRLLICFIVSPYILLDLVVRFC
jgi:hypothetical protein